MAISYDLIIVAASKTEDLIRMTQAAIDSCLRDDVPVNVILVETFRRHNYTGVDHHIMYEGKFCYNKCLNEGLRHATGDVVIMANNDIHFVKGWSTIGRSMIDNGYLSASALSASPRQSGFKRGDYVYEGYLIGIHLTGWCIFAQRKLFDIIGKLDERVNFWYSDNVYADQLKKHNIKHGLICNVTVLHYTSQTFKDERREDKYRLAYAEGEELYRSNTKNLS